MAAMVITLNIADDGSVHLHASAGGKTVDDEQFPSIDQAMAEVQEIASGGGDDAPGMADPDDGSGESMPDDGGAPEDGGPDDGGSAGAGAGAAGVPSMSDMWQQESAKRKGGAQSGM